MESRKRYIFQQSNSQLNKQKNINIKLITFVNLINDLCAICVNIFLFDLFYLLYSTHEKPFHFGGCSFNLDQFYLTLVDVLCGKIEENEVRGYNKIPLHFMITLTEFNCSITVLFYSIFHICYELWCKYLYWYPSWYGNLKPKPYCVVNY